MLLIRRHDPLVKLLRHGPFTAVTWVQIPYGSFASLIYFGIKLMEDYPSGLRGRF